MGSKFDKKDLIGTVAMLGLATLLVVKLAPNFMDKPVTETKPEPKVEQTEQAIKPEAEVVKEVTELPTMNMAAITLPEPPPLEVAEDLQPDPAEAITAQSEQVTKTASVKPAVPKPAPKQIKTIKPIQAQKTVKPVIQEAQPAPQPKPEAKSEPIKVAALKATPDLVQPQPAPVAKPLQPVQETTSIPEVFEEQIVQVEPMKQRPQLSQVEAELDDSDLERFRAQPVKAIENDVIQESVTARATVTASLNNRKAVQTGRSLLKLLEHGQGPAIEIAWPESMATREKLYAHLTQCHGMVTAALAQSVFYKAGLSSRWDFNPDLYSGFLRQPTGSLPQDEQFQLRQIQNQHNLNGNLSPVRLFPRQSDAILLGGLQQLVGQNYMKAKTIRGRYILRNGSLHLEDIRMDGLHIDGDILLAPANKHCGGWA